MKIKIAFILLFIAKISSAQNEKEQLYVFDQNWKPVEVKKAIYLIHVQHVADSVWQWDYYNLYGPMIKSEQFTTKDGDVLNGHVCYYKNGDLDSSGIFKNGKKNGVFWKYINGDSMKVKFQYRYDNDSLIEAIDVAKRDIEMAAKKDSIKKSGSVQDSVKIEIESEYPGGNAGWAKYLRNNLKYPDRAIDGNYQGIVSVLFIVDKQGNVIDPCLAKSVEYSLDNEALLIIKNSGKWTAAFQDGRKVKSYKQQPIVFRLR